jgi:hypothetical protein
LLLVLPLASIPISAATADSEELVRIEKLAVRGSRFELQSVQMLTGLRLGQQINEASLRRAIQRMTDTGLVKNVDYSYASASKPTSVALELTIVDETPLLPASVQLPDVDAEDLWAYLKSIDPLFTRELPRTQKAIQYYVRYIERYLANRKHPMRVATVITADAEGNASGIVFVPADLLGIPQMRNKKN